jgi:large exoprotein involved in heme utilization and adhesion
LTVLISSSSVSAQGDVGSITINTPKLTLQGGALISSSTYGTGKAGSITLNVSESLEMSGSGLNSVIRRIEPFAVRTAGILLPATTRKALGLPDQITGSAGTVLINTPNLQITDGALLSVSHESLGNAGKLTINANRLRLNTGSKITATTASGEEGNITLNLRESLLLRNGSFINTEARGTGNGGNITINAPIILGLENSHIFANAIGGRGGKIEITTQGILGLAFRNTKIPRTDLTNDITASSGVGLDGTVTIKNVGVDPNSGLIALSNSLSDPSQKITKGCSTTQASEFVVTGRGGIPQNPIEQSTGRNRACKDLRSLTSSTPSVVVYSTPTLVEATRWERDLKLQLRAILEVVRIGNKHQSLLTRFMRVYQKSWQRSRQS